MALVKNPGPQHHRVGGSVFPPGVVVECDDALARYVVEEMKFERVDKPAQKPIAEGAPVTKPAQAKKK